jgi:stage II sporulation protein D
VIPNESPSSWPQPALRAQAVAARSYALATTVNGNGYELYDDTRSQVYGGKSSETRNTNQAAKGTTREVIKSGGNVATAFFFSTSGGQTENSEFGFPGGGTPRPYLKSVNDPFDDVSPHHSWTERFSQSEMESKLSGLFQGKLKGIKVLNRGESPRIVRARVVGSNGSSEVHGDTIRFRLGLRSTWARFKKR